MNNYIDIQHLCDLVHSTFHVPVQFLATNKKLYMNLPFGTYT